MSISETRRQELLIIGRKLIDYEIDGKKLSKAGMEDGNRIQYFYGDKGLSALMKGSWNLSRNEAFKCLVDMLKGKLIHRVERIKPPKGTQMNGNVQQVFDEESLYCWDIEAEESKWNRFGGILLVIGALAVTMFSIMANVDETGVWYLSLIALILLISAIVLHFVVNWIAWLFGNPDFYLFPYLFHDDPNKGVFDAFKPIYGKWVDPKGKKKSSKKDNNSNNSNNSNSPISFNLNLNNSNEDNEEKDD